jgi:uncharacterized protein YdeI (YjbR/CyaY-like superfamily)
MAPAPTFFATPAEFRTWLEKHHATASELWVGFHKQSARKPGLTYEQAVDEALCFGWIDGIIRRVDDTRYMHRFTRRTARSIWSRINVAKVARLTTAGKMHAAGLAAFAARDNERTGIYSFEKAAPRLSAADERRFRTHRKAWAFFQEQPPGYRRLALHRVLSPKRADTRERWLAKLIAASAAGRRLPGF